MFLKEVMCDLGYQKGKEGCIIYLFISSMSLHHTYDRTVVKVYILSWIELKVILQN